MAAVPGITRLLETLFAVSY